MKTIIIFIILIFTLKIFLDEIRKQNSAIPQSKGKVLFILTGDNRSEKTKSMEYRRKLHFCLFENGENDLLYVATHFGGWSHASFELSIDGEAVYTGNTDRLSQNGIMLNVGDIVSKKSIKNRQIRITKISGIFKS